MQTLRTSARVNDVPRIPGFAEDYLPHVILHPAQFRDLWGGGGHSPEKELAAAVIDGAVSDLRNYRYARGRRRQRLYMQAYQWVAAEEREWPFSFVNLCEFLEISPQALRERLLGDEQQTAVAQAA